VIRLGDDTDLVNTDITTFKSLDKLNVGGDIRFDGDMSIAAPHGIGKLIAGRVVTAGGGTLHIGTGLLQYLRFRDDCGADVQVDGTVIKAIIDGQLLRAFTVVGPHGSIDRLLIRRGIAASASVTASNYIGDMDVYGDMAGNVTARGSNGSNLAIASLHIWNGSLQGNVLTEVDPVLGHALPLRPGGGIGILYVKNGDVVGNVTTTSYFDAPSGAAISGDVGVLKIVRGSLMGDVTTLRHDGAAPASDIGRLLVLGGQFIAGKTVLVTGDLGYAKFRNAGGVAVAGNVIVQGAAGEFYTSGDVVTDLSFADGFDVLTVRGLLTADVYSGGPSGTATIYGDMIGNFRVANGGLYAFSAIGGQIQAANPASPVIEVDGKLSYLKVYGGNPLTPAIDGDVQVGGRMRLALVKHGSFAGTLDAQHIERAVYATPDGLVQPLTVTGDLDYLRVVFGPIAAAVSAANGRIGEVRAMQGSTVAGTIVAGTGFDYLYSEATVRGSVTVLSGHFKKMVVSNSAGVAIATTILVQSGDFRKLVARGSVENSLLLAASGAFGPAVVTASFVDSSLIGRTLDEVRVKGQIVDNGGVADVIRAVDALDVFRIWDADQYERIDALNNHVDFGGVDVFVG